MIERERLNRVAHVYIACAVASMVLILLLALLCVSGLNHAPWRAWPQALLGYLVGTLRTDKRLFFDCAAVAAVLVALTAWFAARRASRIEVCVGQRKEHITALTGVILFVRDVTAGVVMTIINFFIP